jgi:hypothetical protein
MIGNREKLMAEFEDRAKALAATAGKIARLQDAKFEADLLEESLASLVKTGSQEEDWGEVRDFYTFMLEVPIPTYAVIDNQREKLEKSICRRVQQLVRTQFGKLITEVVISPILAEESRPVEIRPEEEKPQEETPSFWQTGFFRLFISHTSTNKESAHRLKDWIARYNVAAFVAHDDIEPTKEWEAEIERALRTMDALAAIISPDFFESRWCDQEVGFAFGRSKLVVPICKDAIPHGFLGKYQGFKTQGLVPSVVAEKLANILVEHPLTTQRMTDALVERMVASGSWEDSKRTMALLEKVPRLNESQVAKLVQSAEDNSEVRSAFSVPDRIQSLVTRIGKGPSAT